MSKKKEKIDMFKKVSTKAIKAMIASNTPIDAQYYLKYWHLFGAITKAQYKACLPLVAPIVWEVSVRSRYGTLTCK